MTYAWAVTQKPTGSNSSFTSNIKSPTVTFDRAGAYQFQVTVTDSKGGMSFGTVNVTVQQPPTGLQDSLP
jgi:PKD repeat protein